MFQKLKFFIGIFLLMAAPARQAIAASAELKVSGNKIVTVSGNCPIFFKGGNLTSLEWKDTSDGPILTSAQTLSSTWGANIFRVPMNQDRWLGTACGTNAAAYQAQYDNLITWCNANNVYVMLDLHWSDTGTAGGGSVCTSGQHDMPDNNSATFWTSVATRYANNTAVLFDIYNEPKGISSWSLWKNGGTGMTDGGYNSPGMQSLLNTIRATGAKNIVVAGGLNWAFDLTGVPANALTDSTGNGVVYATHIYPWKASPCLTPCFDAAVPASVHNNYAVMVTEFGQDNNANGVPNNSWSQSVMDWAKTNTNGYIAWCVHNSASPCLIADWSYTPTGWFGVTVKADMLATSAGGCVGTSTFTPSRTRTLTSTPTRTATPLIPTFTSTFTLSSTPTFTPTRSSTPLVPTFTFSSTLTRTSTLTSTRTATLTITPTPMPPTATFTATLSSTPSSTVSMTGTPTFSSTLTRSPTSSATRTATPLIPTPTFTATLSSTPSLTDTLTRSPTATVTRTATVTLSFTPMIFSPTYSPTLTNSSSPTPTYTVTLTKTPSLTLSATRTATSSVTRSPTPSLTPSLTSTPASSGTLTSSATATLSFTPMIFSPTLSPTSTATLTATLSRTGTSSVTITDTPTSSPTITRTNTSSSTLTVTESSTETAVGTFTDTPVLSATPTQTPSSSPTPTSSATLTPPRIVTSTLTSTPSFSVTSTETASPGPLPSAVSTATFTSSPTMATAAGTAMPEDGPGEIEDHKPVPNPNPAWLAFKLKGRAEDVELRLYSKAMVCIEIMRKGQSAGGWQRFELSQNTANGLYYYRITALKGNKPQGKAGIGSIMVAR